MNRFIPVIVALLALASPLSASADHSAWRDSRIVRCASDSGRSRTCHIDTRGGVRLVRQESGAPCIRGRSWNYNAGGIWVGHGCRAQFEVRDPRYAYASGSRSYRDARYDRGYYGNDRGYYGVSSGYPNRGYGYNDPRYANPVAAVLGAVLGTGTSYGNGYGRYDGYGTGYYGRQPQAFRCESDDGRPRFCRLPFHASNIAIHRQLSRTRCAEGYNWGWRSDGVWVERGCRAEFVVY